ncbi:hypothetical protein GPECTOR_5g127 [Gonium pectorale]|uniref:Uncharacterized protein n=1 Tax=Gonium pectorale TaxID=33097 RepID=A0A150GVW3_GONPE|nr:hypothetical protein GPECTOR_5g127 [Gonium pectorale]|eukprot:KXZ54016.1 hypothetical protein GPECTOR_5g127 [Gonium pectorale]
MLQVPLAPRSPSYAASDATPTPTSANAGLTSAIYGGGNDDAARLAAAREPPAWAPSPTDVPSLSAAAAIGASGYCGDVAGGAGGTSATDADDGRVEYTGSGGGGGAMGVRPSSAPPATSTPARGRSLPSPVTVQVASRSRRRPDGGAVGGVARGTVGTFHPRLYLAGGDCIECDGEMMSRGRFERLAGSVTAKWHVSIKVLPSGVTLGRWLQQHGLPVLQGRPRKRRAGDGEELEELEELEEARSASYPRSLRHTQSLRAALEETETADEGADREELGGEGRRSAGAAAASAQRAPQRPPGIQLSPDAAGPVAAAGAAAAAAAAAAPEGSSAAPTPVGTATAIAVGGCGPFDCFTGTANTEGNPGSPFEQLFPEDFANMYGTYGTDATDEALLDMIGDSSLLDDFMMGPADFPTQQQAPAAAAAVAAGHDGAEAAQPALWLGQGIQGALGAAAPMAAEAALSPSDQEQEAAGAASTAADTPRTGSLPATAAAAGMAPPPGLAGMRAVDVRAGSIPAAQAAAGDGATYGTTAEAYDFCSGGGAAADAATASGSGGRDGSAAVGGGSGGGARGPARGSGGGASSHASRAGDGGAVTEASAESYLLAARGSAGGSGGGGNSPFPVNPFAALTLADLSSDAAQHRAAPQPPPDWRAERSAFPAGADPWVAYHAAAASAGAAGAMDAATAAATASGGYDADLPYEQSVWTNSVDAGRLPSGAAGLGQAPAGGEDAAAACSSAQPAAYGAPPPLQVQAALLQQRAAAAAAASYVSHQRQAAAEAAAAAEAHNARLHRDFRQLHHAQAHAQSQRQAAAAAAAAYGEAERYASDGGHGHLYNGACDR